MENGNDKSQSVGDEYNTGTWIIALTRNGEGYLGCVQMLNTINPYRDGDDPKQRDQVGVAEVLAAKSITLNPVFEYREMVREVPVMDPRSNKMMIDPNTNSPALQPMRTPLIMPVGFTLEMHPVHVPGLCYGTVIRFLSQMDQRDADTQRKFARDCRGMMSEMRLRASGLVPATADDVGRIR